MSSKADSKLFWHFSKIAFCCPYHPGCAGLLASIASAIFFVILTNTSSNITENIFDFLALRVLTAFNEQKNKEQTATQ